MLYSPNAGKYFLHLEYPSAALCDKTLHTFHFAGRSQEQQIMAQQTLE